MTRWFLVGSAVVTASLYVVPYGRLIAYPLILLSTLAHEMGHGLAAIAVGADFESFQMWSDGSGMAYIRGNSNCIGQAIIAAGGLVGPAVLAAICFFVAKKEILTRWSLRIWGTALIVSEFLIVRNLFAWIFVGILAGIFLFLAHQSRPWIAQTSLVFVALQLALSVFSRGDYLFTPTAQTAQGYMPSDVANMSQALFLPYWFWGGACGLFSILVLVLGIRAYVKNN